MNVLEAFGLPGPRFVHVIGAGGKSTLLRALAESLVASGARVLCTTTTRIRESESAGTLVLADAVPDVRAAVAAAFAGTRLVTLAGGRVPGAGKLAGVPPPLLEPLVAARLADVTLVEADGAAGRPLKAHAPHEPAIARSADAVVMVVGAGILGRPATDEHVHRAAMLRERLRVTEAHGITAADVAAIVLHPEGGLARVSPGAGIAAYVRHDSSAGRAEGARRIAGAILAADRDRRLARVVVGDTLAGAFTLVAR